MVVRCIDLGRVDRVVKIYAVTRRGVERGRFLRMEGSKVCIDVPKDVLWIHVIYEVDGLCKRMVSS